MTRKTIWTYEEITSSHITMFRIVALTPFKNKTLNNFRTIFIGLCCHIGSLVFSLMYLGYGIQMSMRETLETDYICEHVVVINIHFRYIIMYLKRKKLLQLLSNCKEIWSLITPEESNVVRNYERKAYYFRNFMLINMVSCIFLFVIPGHFITMSPQTGNYTAFRKPPFKTFWKITSDSQYNITMSCQIVMVFIGGMVLCGAETVANFLVFISCGFLKVIRQRLLSISEMAERNCEKCNKDVFADNRIKSDIFLHQKVMLYCGEIEKFLRSYYFTTVFSAIYNLSLLLLQMLKSDEETAKYLGMFVINSFQFFTCQWGPQYLLTESTGISKAAYFAISGKFQKQKQIHHALSFMIMRAQKPVQMTAGGFANLSRECFATMVKSAYSFFALLRNFNN